MVRAHTRHDVADSLSMTSTPWKPFLRGRWARLVSKAVEDIALSFEHDRTRAASLASGRAGLSLFQAWWDPSSHLVMNNLERAALRASENVNLRFLDGLPGVAWASQLLQFFDKEGALVQFRKDATALCLRAAGSTGQLLPFDLGGGLVGLATCALEQWPSVLGRRLFERVTRHLIQRAEQTDGAVAWPVQPEHVLTPDLRRGYGKIYDLGLAHGSLGVLVILAMAFRLKVCGPQVRQLVHDGVKWILSRKREHVAEGLPSFLTLPAGPLTSRLGWCYGDASLAAALFVVSRLMGNRAWAEEAIHVARRLTPDHPAANTVTDAALCHGAAGLMHINHRLYQWSQDKILKKNTQAWLDVTLAFHRRGQMASGVTGKTARSIGVLTGSSGVGLALLATIQDREPSWDRFMLLSVPNLMPRGS
jgi:lantibiotic biosynthesis protein